MMWREPKTGRSSTIPRGREGPGASDELRAVWCISESLQDQMDQPSPS
jgi:hypothetical protein